ncbi:MAG: DUF3018 family protein [Deltaproteobacteria bacterium]|nr:DUF3018 family protein [Deltaproteobacteria bacterium]
MARPKADDTPPRRAAPSRLAKHRAEMRRRGFKLVQLWVPDPGAPGFREAVRRTREFLLAHPDREWDAFASRVLDAAPGWDES